MEEFRINILIAAVLVGTLLVGCSSKGSTNINENSVTDTISVSQGSDLVSSAEDETKSSDSEYSTYDSDSEQSSNTGSSSTSSSTEISENTSGVLDTSDMFSTRDLTQEADTSAAKDITVSDGKTIDITEEGVYVISGSAKNCTIKVSADKEAKVQLVLDGVSITNDSTPAIYVVSADKCFVTTTSSENTLTVTGSFTADGDTNTDAVIFSKDDIVLNGVGTLNITSTDNGISGKDDLKITGGTYNITSTADAIEANDSIRICGGTFNISTSKDALHSENDDDDTQGFIYISGGNFTINASSDAIQGTTAVQIDGGTAVEVCRNNDFDIIIMDIMMPDMDGFTACKKIREFKDIPVLMLSARGTEYDKLFGFEVGIDDYVTKPFSPKELMARIKVIISRHSSSKPTESKRIKAKGIEIDTLGHDVYIDGEKTELTAKEYGILVYLIENKGIVLSRDKILNAVWGYEYFGDDRTVDWQIKLLRNKLGKYRDTIHTIRGVGYKFED